MTQKEATERKMKWRQETTSLGQIASLKFAHKQELLDFYMNLRLNSGGSRPFDKEGGWEGGKQSQKNFFRLLGPQFGLKIRRGGPRPGSATA